LKTFIVESTSYNPWFNLALEEYLFDRIEPDSVVLYLWQNQNTVVIGKTQNAWKECRCAQLEADGGKLARRPSGGGAVFHDMGNMCFTFLASKELYDLERQLKVILEAVKMHGIDANFTGRNDITTADGRKFSGNAFRFSKGIGLQHGTILMDTDGEKMAKFLQVSVAKMQSKGIDSVRSRVVNLITLNPDITADSMKKCFTIAFHKEYGASSNFEVYDESALNAVKELVPYYDKYSSWEWRYGSNPSFDMNFETRFPWGCIEICISSDKGIITDAKVFSDAMDVNLPENITAALPGTPLNFEAVKTALLQAKMEGLTDQINDIIEWLHTVL